MTTPIKGPDPLGPSPVTLGPSAPLQGPGVVEIPTNAPGDIKKVTCRLVSPKNKERDSDLKRYFRNNVSVIALAVGLSA